MFSVDYALWPFLLWKIHPLLELPLPVAFLSRTAHCAQCTVERGIKITCVINAHPRACHTRTPPNPCLPLQLWPYLWLPALIVGLPFGYRLITISIVLLYFFCFCFCFLAAFQFDRLMRQLQKAAQLIRRYIREHMYPTYLVHHLHIPCTYILFLYLYIFMTF